LLKIQIVPVTEYQQNCSIVYDDQSNVAVVVDPGGEVEKIAAAAEELGVKVEAIWLTHGHLDHAGGAEAAKKHFGVDIVGPHQDDKMLLDNIETVAAGYGMSGMHNASPDRWLTEGETVSVGEQEFEVRHCPGHAPGHVVFINHANKFILMGDVLFRGSIGRTDLPGGNLVGILNRQRLGPNEKRIRICNNKASLVLAVAGTTMESNLGSTISRRMGIRKFP